MPGGTVVLEREGRRREGEVREEGYSEVRQTCFLELIDTDSKNSSRAV